MRAPPPHRVAARGIGRPTPLCGGAAVCAAAHMRRDGTAVCAAVRMHSSSCRLAAGRIARRRRRIAAVRTGCS